MRHYLVSLAFECIVATALFILLAMTVVTCSREIRWGIGD